jgi:hypothetical protein
LQKVRGQIRSRLDLSPRSRLPLSYIYNIL